MLRLIFSGSGFLFLSLLLMFQINGFADRTNRCPPSACGGITISYPFRLRTDPTGCGDDQYTLSCENNFTVLHLTYVGKYHEQAINYNNFTIRLVDIGVDRDDCSSLPTFPLTNNKDFYRLSNYSYDLYKYKQNSESEREWETLPKERISFIKCENAVNSSLYLDASPCINYSSLSHSETVYTYAYFGELKGYDLRDGCSLEMVSLMLPTRDSNNKNSSIVDIHRQMAFGFEVSWHSINCRNCSMELCYRDSKDHIHCPYGLKTGFAHGDPYYEM